MKKPSLEDKELAVGIVIFIGILCVILAGLMIPKLGLALVNGLLVCLAIYGVYLVFWITRTLYYLWKEGWYD